MGAGRPAQLIELVERTGGSEIAKQRARAILQVSEKSKGVAEAYGELGIKASRFEEIRMEAIRGLVETLEPKAAGRPRKENPEEDPEAARLRAENMELKKALYASLVREELAALFPSLRREGPKKKRM